MKSKRVLIGFLGLGILAFSCQKAGPIDTGYVNLIASLAAINQTVIGLPKENLEDDEKARVLFIREEEKLAYDVYKTLYDRYGVRVFQNIPNSELSHMEAMLSIIRKYELPDPMDSNPIGIFKDIDLQRLYGDLVADGNKSLLAAYQVGAKIEELDIMDLNKSISVTNNRDIRLVYDFLNKGSRNHLRSFYKNILELNGTYKPIFISQSEFDAIVNSPMERM
jgi:hypothetical protein